LDFGLSGWVEHPKSKIKNLKYGGGFTLIEVVLVAVAMAILLTALLPGFQRTTQRLRVEHAAFEFAQLARLAHERAVNETRETIWTWDEERLRARVEAADAVSPEVPPQADSQDGMAAEANRVESSPMPVGIVVSVARGSEDVACHCVRFFPEGTAEGTSVTVSMDDHAYTVTVDAATGQTWLTAGALAR